MASESPVFSKDEPAWQREYPFQRNSFSIGDHCINYVDEGPVDGAAGGPVLFVHGNPTWSFYYRNLINAVSHNAVSHNAVSHNAVGQSRRSIAIDNIGCGFSDKPADYDYCLQNHIDNACKLIDHLDLNNVTLVAHDWGGAIGMGALQARPDRFQTDCVV